MEQLTLSIIKPDATKKHLLGKIIGRFEEEGLVIAAIKMKHLTKKEAEGFYAEHAARPFFGELVEYMSSGPVVLMALKGSNAIEKNRNIMGATNPKEAKEGTLRRLFGTSIGENAVHGSDSPESAKREIAYFFAATEIR